MPIATTAPVGMSSMFFRVECAPTKATPVARVARSGAFWRNQPCARSSSSIFSAVDRLLSAIVIRVAERPMSMRLFRSRPAGSENS